TNERSEPCPTCKIPEVLNEKTIRSEWYSNKNQGLYDVVDTPLRKSDGNITKLRIFRDITEKKKAEIKLKESEEKFRTFTESSPMAILIYQDYQYVYANPAAKNISGYTFEDLSRMKIWDFIHPDYKDIATEGGKAMERGENPPSKAELKIITKSGDKKWIDARLEMIKYQEKRATLITAIDITERKKTEQQLKESEVRYRGLFENSPISLWEEDFSEGKKYIDSLKESGIKDFRSYFKTHPEEIKKLAKLVKIIDVNQATLKLYKAKNKEELVQGLNTIFTEESYEQFKEEIISLCEGKSFKEIEGINRTLQGEDKYISIGLSIAPGSETNWSHVLLSIKDITNQKIAEQKLKESEERYRHLFEQSPNKIVLLDSNRKIIDVNSPFIYYFGLNKEEVLGKDYRKIRPYYLSENLILSEKLYQEVFLKGFFEPFEFQAYDKNEERKWMEIRGSLIDINDRRFMLVILQDIDKRKKTEEDLRLERDKLKAIIDGLSSAGLGIDIIGKDYKVLYINEVMKEKFGDNLSKLCYENIMVSKEPCEDCPVMKSITTKAVEHVEQSAVDNRDYEIFSAPIPNPNGKIDKAVELIIDITERKKAEQKLMESEEKFRTFTEKSLLGIAVLQDNIIKYANDRMAEMSGYSVEEILGWKPEEFMKVISPEQYDFVLEQAKKKQLGLPNAKARYQIKCIKKSGELMYIDSFSKTINYDGKPADLITQIDITEQIEVEQKLQESELKYRYLFEYSPSAVLLFDLKGKILEINPMVRKMFGYTKEDLVGKNFAKLNTIHPDSLSMAVELFKEVVNKGEGSATAEFLYYKQDRTLLWGFTQGSLLKLGDKIYVQSIIQDITELKEAERLILEENKKLLELDRMREEIITRVSHELKTPLIPLINGSELLTTVYRDQLGKQAQEIIEMIYKSGLRLKSLVKNLLDISVIDYNHIELIRKRENLVELINGAIEELSFFTNNRGLTINSTLPKTIYFDIDKSRMEQAIINVLSNAIKNTPKNGEIFIRAVEYKEYIDIEVEDTGVGLTNKEKQRLFEKFGKIERYGKGLDVDIEGSGLGLYITKHLINLHNGEILVESEGRNRGATFTIRLFKKK
ncbi:MAG: PAS domain S-box protein, partial [Candidatus Hermodarchaeota archaeon]